MYISITPKIYFLSFSLLFSFFFQIISKFMNYTLGNSGQVCIIIFQKKTQLNMHFLRVKLWIIGYVFSYSNKLSHSRSPTKMYFLCMLILFTNKIQLTFVFQKIHFFLRLPWPRNQLCMYYFRNKKNKYFFHTIMKLAFINNIKICKKNARTFMYSSRIIAVTCL